MFSRRAYCVPSDDHRNYICIDPTQYAPLVAYCVCRLHKMLQRSILCMQGTQYATKRSILCRGAFCGPTGHSPILRPFVPLKHVLDILVFFTNWKFIPASMHLSALPTSILNLYFISLYLTRVWDFFWNHFKKIKKRAMPALDRSPEYLALEALFMLLTSTRPDCAIIFIKKYILIYDSSMSYNPNYWHISFFTN